MHIFKDYTHDVPAVTDLILLFPLVKSLYIFLSDER